MDILEKHVNDRCSWERYRQTEGEIKRKFLIFVNIVIAWQKRNESVTRLFERWRCLSLISRRRLVWFLAWRQCDKSITRYDLSSLLYLRYETKIKFLHLLFRVTRVWQDMMTVWRGMTSFCFNSNCVTKQNHFLFFFFFYLDKSMRRLWRGCDKAWWEHEVWLELLIWFYLSNKKKKFQFKRYDNVFTLILYAGQNNFNYFAIFVERNKSVTRLCGVCRESDVTKLSNSSC